MSLLHDCKIDELIHVSTSLLWASIWYESPESPILFLIISRASLCSTNSLSWMSNCERRPSGLAMSRFASRSSISIAQHRRYNSIRRVGRYCSSFQCNAQISAHSKGVRHSSLIRRLLGSESCFGKFSSADVSSKRTALSPEWNPRRALCQWSTKTPISESVNSSTVQSLNSFGGFQNKVWLSKLLAGKGRDVT